MKDPTTEQLVMAAEFAGRIHKMVPRMGGEGGENVCVAIRGRETCFNRWRPFECRNQMHEIEAAMDFGQELAYARNLHLWAEAEVDNGSESGLAFLRSTVPAAIRFAAFLEVV